MSEHNWTFFPVSSALASEIAPDRLTVTISETLGYKVMQAVDNHHNVLTTRLSRPMSVTLASGETCVVDEEDARRAILTPLENASFMDRFRNWLRKDGDRVFEYDAPAGTIPNLCRDKGTVLRARP